MATHRCAPSEAPERAGWNPLTLAAWAAVWIAALANWPLWRALAALPEMSAARGTAFMLGFGIMVAALTAALMTPLAWRPIIKPVIAAFLLSAAIEAHFMGTYGIVIDTTMMLNVLQTDPREVRDLLTLRLFASVAVLAGLPLLLLWQVRVRRLTAVRQLGLNAIALAGAVLVIALLLVALFADLSATMRNHKSLRYLINPVNSFYALADLAWPQAKRAGPPEVIGTSAYLLPRPAGIKPPLLMLVVGETARADHFSLNGYKRPTNPELSRLDVLSFRNVSSCGTNTAASLPCMFSHLGRQAFEGRDHEYENLLDLAQRAGLAVLWLDNQSGCKGLCERVPNALASDPVPGGAAATAGLCNGGECLDAALLVGLDARLAALPLERRARGVLLVLHQMGSHGPAYFKRSPLDRKPFLPECETNALQQCELESLVNAYDNSIAYTDHVLADAVTWLQTTTPHYTPALLYLSDHGESLGDNNLYLHGLPYAIAPREQTHVPMIVWLPRGEGQRMQAKCLEARLDSPLSHDNMFHTVLGLLGVRADEYRVALDLLAGCRGR